VPGSRHEKRWEDVPELLGAGIDVITALNVQHIDSLTDAVEAITGVGPHETVPDAVPAAADEIEFVDITPQQLRARIADTQILASGAAPQALTGFYTAERLAGLRELAMGWLQQRDHVGPAAQVALSRASAGVASQRVVVASPPRSVPSLIGVHVCEPSGLIQAEPAWLTGQTPTAGRTGRTLH
jgi:two-component system sensor histidine kinase KdpD